MSFLPDDLKGVFFECSICTLEYGLAQDRIPRVLNCGHTFCTSCLHQCLRMDSIPCPFCKKLTKIAFGDMSRIPVNYGILDMIQPDTESPDKQHDNVCEACEVNIATIVCISCSPVGVKFCADCDRQEHNRKFKPVQLHRRMELSQYEPTLVCSRHPGSVATYYSEQSNRFACHECETESDWPVRNPGFLQIQDAAELLRTKASKKNYTLNSATRMLYDTQKELENTLLKLAESTSQAKSAILGEFKRLSDILQQRQQKLILRVEQEYESRKDSIEAQKTRIQERSQVVASHHDALRSLLALPDRDFLKGYHHVMEQVVSLKDDSMLFRPVAPGVIPCFFKASLDQELNNHGAVGGGPVPENVVCNRVPIPNCTLPQLSWSLSKDSSEINQYEVEYEHISDERPSSPRNSGPITVANDSKLVTVPKSGRAQAHVMNDLYPGCRYRFRVRSKSIAGWGIWSVPITGRFENLPVKVAFTGEKVAIRIPTTGQYRVTAAGARAADGNNYKGGLGAVLSGIFSLNVHDRIEIAVGGMSQKGSGGHSGGAGGTFVLLCNNGHPTIENILIIAGGGGGTRGFDDDDKDGCDASLEPWGTDGKGKEHGAGGKNGNPGEDANSTFFQGPCWGYGGAGFLVSSTTAKCYIDGLEGGQCGGYGGGGGVGMLGGGGGGGFSGGGGGRGGGGGGSYISPSAINVTRQVGHDHHGFVLIERINSETQLVNGSDNLKQSNDLKHSSGNSSPVLSNEDSPFAGR